ncbi:MAG: lytic transglycosylase domain-containing protein [Bacteroidales bacterium]|jgi:hypothetical protein|nr:lytic transglycosylase domain-containing protein [Bacteroidales bacterium]
MLKNLRNRLFPITFLLITGVCFLLLSISSPEKSLTTTQIDSVFASGYHLSSPPLPNKLQFAGEDVPVDYYDVREALDRELLINVYWQSNILLYCKRAYRYFPVIEPILKAEGIPDDFKYLALIESGLLNVVSPAKAAGIWQFMKETGISCGLEISEDVDERYHLEKATFAACKYLKQSYNQHGSWTLAAAAYNMGDGGVKRVTTGQQTTSYWDLLLNDETARYVYRILAAKIILSNPKDYGIHLRMEDMYQPLSVKSITVDTSIADLVSFARSWNISYKEFKSLNPWLRTDKLTNKLNKSYNLVVGQPKYRSYRNQIGNF